MSAPRSLEEWAKDCYQQSHRGSQEGDVLCLKCARAYAAQVRQEAQAQVVMEMQYPCGHLRIVEDRAVPCKTCWEIKKLGQEEREAFKKILDEPFVVGTRVTNCVVHMSLDFYSRPRDCDLCATDIIGHLQLAIRVNEFLNKKVDAAASRAREP